MALSALAIVAADAVFTLMRSPEEVKQLRRKIRHAIASYVASMESGRPYLTAASNEGIAWDWQKPCYYDTLHYQCDMDVTLTDDDNEQEE